VFVGARGGDDTRGDVPNLLEREPDQAVVKLVRDRLSLAIEEACPDVADRTGRAKLAELVGRDVACREPGGDGRLEVDRRQPCGVLFEGRYAGRHQRSAADGNFPDPSGRGA